MMMGNLSVEQIEREHEFEFTDEERSYLKEHWHQVADFKAGESGWHMFDLPPFLVVSNGPVGKECLRIFMAHDDDYRYQVPGGFGAEEVE